MNTYIISYITLAVLGASRSECRFIFLVLFVLQPHYIYCYEKFTEVNNQWNKSCCNSFYPVAGTNA